MKFLISLVSTAIVGFALSGCIAPDMNGPINPVVQPQVSRGIEGQWIDSEGVAFSSFRNGIFETRSIDTQEKLSEGNYAMTSPQMVSLEMRSLVRGTVSRVNCALSGYSRLLCTTESGSHFTLTRQ